MCGIVGYIGNQEATPIILEGLRKLEYRGYDSAGVCVINAGAAALRRSEGKLVNLDRLLKKEPIIGEIGIGHTRWATHGRPSETNAHPHQAGSIIVVHNGIIENYLELKGKLKGLGRQFKSETDTEVISHIIDEKFNETGCFEKAVRLALQELRGAYAVCILCEKDPGVLIAAKQGSPMVVGLGAGEYFVASDIPAILSHTREMVFMEDGEMAVFRDGGAQFSTVAGESLDKNPRHIDWSPLMAEKSGYKHFMLKEIFEQPRAIRDTIAGRLLEEAGSVFLENLDLSDGELASVERICIVACGTSWHAALVGKFFIEEHCRIPVEVDIASEFRYRNPIVNDKTLMVLISQSGETADTLAALREGKRRGAKNVAICNVVDSSIARESHGVIYTHAGLEIGVASTKAFVTQLAALYLFTIKLGRTIGTIDLEKGRAMVAALIHVPTQLDKVLELNPQMKKLARTFMNADDFLYLGRGINYPIALEGALKLKEISYIHAEGYPAGEMKHGPIALITDEVPVVVVATQGRTYEKVVSNIQEVRARGARVIAVATSGDEDIRKHAEHVLQVPATSEVLSAIPATVPLQLLAYRIAKARGCNVDQPRNLAKSVTVE